jgi:hypothetical protein
VLAEKDYQVPCAGEPVGYRAVGCFKSGCTIGRMHYRMCCTAEDDCKEMLKSGAVPVYLEQLALRSKDGVTCFVVVGRKKYQEQSK